MKTEIDLVSDWIRTEANYDGELDPDLDLLETHVLDSFNIVQLAMYLQDEFSIELEAEDLVRENLSKLSSIVALIRLRRSPELS